MDKEWEKVGEIGVDANGDGSYDVFVKKDSEGRIMEAKVVFISEDEDD